MQAMIFGLITFLIAAFAFGYGAIKLFKKKKPLYWKILVCAAGCFALQQLSTVINLWCNVTSPVSIGMRGIFGCNLFLLSANYGALDRLVDDGRGTQKARKLALLAPVIMGELAVGIFLSWRNIDLLCGVIWPVVLLPAIPGSYFNLKHLLLPMDLTELLRATKPGNIAALLFYLFTGIYGVASALAGDTVTGLLSVLMALSMLDLTICAVKGANQWTI